MNADFFAYWNSLWHDIPIWVYEAGILVLLAGLVICLLTCGIRKGLRYVDGLFLIEYVILIYCSTVIFRVSGSETGHEFMPFWSYGAYFRGENPRLLSENIMNMLVFVPVGFLIGTQKRWSVALIVGATISVIIETFQFFLHRGFAEVDDVMHNMMGCLIGYGVFRLIRSSWQHFVHV